ncbi:MAG: Rho termination factor N-terminal domain-containing protein, partial [Egibacteraceae bacterium]
MDQSALASKQLTELKGIAAHLQMRGYQRLRKADLIQAIIQAANGGSPRAPAQERDQERARQSGQSGGSDRPIGDAAPQRDERSQSAPGEPAMDADASPGDQAEAVDGLVRTRVRTRARARTRDT